MNKDIIIAGAVALNGSLTLYEAEREKCYKYFSNAFCRSIEQIISEIAGDPAAKTISEEVDDPAAKMISEAADDSTTAKMIKDIICDDDYILELKYGLHYGLWEMKTELKCGFDIDEKQVPVLQETVEILEYLDKDYFEVDSKGAFLIVTSQGNRLQRELKENNLPAVIVGRTTKGHAGNLLIDERIRHLEKPKKPEILKKNRAAL